ncbi:MAG: alkaline phosphatase family protein, partial [Acidobacteriota bacterium]
MTRSAWLAAPAAIALLISCGGPGREASPAAAAPPVELSDASIRTSSKPGTRRVIWLGLDAADWDYFERLSRAGKIPNWKRLSEEGLGVRLESFEPILSPILWTTQETGVGPDVHR